MRKNLFSAINLGQLWSHLAKQKKNEKMERDVQIILSARTRRLSAQAQVAALISKHLWLYIFLSFFLLLIGGVSWPSSSEPAHSNFCFWNMRTQLCAWTSLISLSSESSSSSLDIFFFFSLKNEAVQEEKWTFKSTCDNLRMLIHWVAKKNIVVS